MTEKAFPTEADIPDDAKGDYRLLGYVAHDKHAEARPGDEILPVDEADEWEPECLTPVYVSGIDRAKCGWSLDDEDLYQTDCGTEFVSPDFLTLKEMPSMKYCANCGRRIRDDSPAPDADERED